MAEVFGEAQIMGSAPTDSMRDLTVSMRESRRSERAIQTAGSYRNELGVDKPLHTHPSWEIVYYLEGKIGCRVGDRVQDVWPGVLLVIPPRVSHGEVAREPWACHFLHLDRGLPEGWPSVVHEGAREKLGHIVGALVEEWRTGDPERETMLELLLAQLDIVLRRSLTRRPPTAAEAQVQALERLLEERSGQNLAMPDLAREVGVSYSHLRAQFVRLRGLTPMQRLHQIRCRQAIDMIRNSDLNLEAIADTCGYASASHMSHHLLRATGRRPGAFRAAGVIQERATRVAEDRRRDLVHAESRSMR
jgi:AraC-like DNA-binding protein